MRLDFNGERVLAVVAHPDDAELLCAGTLARARKDGAAIGICVACRGDKGQPSKPVRNLTMVRRREFRAAARLLGAETFGLEIADATLCDDPPTRRLLIDVYRRFRPTLVLAHWQQDYHVDHRAASSLAEAASWLSASRGHRSDQPPLKEPPALWWMDTVGMHDFPVGFYVDISAEVELKERMLACHQSQIERQDDRDFAPLLDLMRQQMGCRGQQAGVQAAEAFRIHTAFKRCRAW